MKRGKRATLASRVSEARAGLHDSFIAPPFYVEILGVQSLPINDPIVADKLANAVGLAAKNLHAAVHIDPKFHKAFVYKLGHYYDFAFHRLQGGEIAATLTALSDHRVRVTYHNGKEPETLYL